MRLLDFGSVRIIDNNGSASVKAFTEWRTLLGTTATTPGCTIWARLDVTSSFTLDDLVDFFLRMEVPRVWSSRA